MATAEDIWEILKDVPRPDGRYGVAADFFEEVGDRELAVTLRWFSRWGSVPTGFVCEKEIDGGIERLYWDGDKWVQTTPPRFGEWLPVELQEKKEKVADAIRRLEYPKTEPEFRAFYRFFKSQQSP